MTKGSSVSREQYAARINRVLDYIQANLAGDLSLGTLAGVACFSPFHFHRIFRALVGETSQEFIRRLRLERAAARLLCGREPITSIAYDYGFANPETFARAFRERYGMSASQWRRVGAGESKNRQAKGKLDQTDSKDGQEIQASVDYLPDNDNPLRWRISMTASQLNAKVEVKELPEMTVAYVRHIGSYKGDELLFARLFEKLFRWAGPRGLLGSPDTKVMAIYHDDPSLTDESKLRTDAALTVPAATPVDGEVGKLTLAGGRYAMAHFELLPTQYEEAWNLVFGGWLPESGFQPTDGACFEIYRSNPAEHPEGKCLVDICIPVKPL